MDDFNMPAKDTYGSQPLLEMIRLWLDFGFCYDWKKYRHPICTFHWETRLNSLKQIQFVFISFILKEQMKTHGQLFDIAIRTIDKDSKVATLSKIFFKNFLNEIMKT